MNSTRQSRAADRPSGSNPSLPLSLLPVLGILYAGTALLLGVVVVASRVLDRPVGVFVRETPEMFPEVPWYAGFFSTLGVLGWWTTVTACLVAAAALWKRSDAAGAFLVAGLFTGVLAFDDAFMLHDIPLGVLLGVPELAVYSVYGAAVLVYAWVFREFVLAAAWPVLVVAGIFFSGSIGVDLLHQDRLDLLEEGSKFLGIATLGTFFVREAIVRVRSEQQAERSAP